MLPSLFLLNGNFIRVPIPAGLATERAFHHGRRLLLTILRTEREGGLGELTQRMTNTVSGTPVYRLTTNQILSAILSINGLETLARFT